MKENKNILVTGASSGFGLLVASELHRRGYRVVGTSRNPEKMNVPFKMLKLDIASEASISSFHKELFKQFEHLDVLINNAGFYLSGLAEETTIEEGKEQFETNFWGTIRLTNALLPALRNQGFGKIITLGSMMGLINLPNGAYYGASKHALEGYFKSLRFELYPFNIKVAMVEPMGFKTGIINNSITSQSRISDYNIYRSKVAKYSDDVFGNAPEPTPVIDKILKLVEDKNPTFNHPVGKGASIIWALHHFAYKTFEKSIIQNLEKIKHK